MLLSEAAHFNLDDLHTAVKEADDAVEYLRSKLPPEQHELLTADVTHLHWIVPREGVIWPHHQEALDGRDVMRRQ